MERKSPPARARLIEALKDNIWQVNFYRFCQLLEQVAPAEAALGTTSCPEDDGVCFCPLAEMGFPASELKRVEQANTVQQLPIVRTTFLGLYGVDSPMMGSYLDDITQRREGHEAVTAFLDIFNHRVTTQYYRIWRKYVAYPASFMAGGKDAISQCLLGLVGLGIQGTAAKIATPLSRFLALLGTMRLPTRTAEGIDALCKLLAPQTATTISDTDPINLLVDKRSGLQKQQRISLGQRATLGKTGRDATSQIVVTLLTYDATEAIGWLPGGQLHSDLLALLRVYLGYRSDVRLRMQLPLALLAAPYLKKTVQLQLGRTGVLGFKQRHDLDRHQTITVKLGYYRGLRASVLPPAIRIN